MKSIRPVTLGVLLGVITLVFGIFWAVYITTQHDQIHKTLSESAKAAVKDKFVISSQDSAHQHSHEGAGHDGHDHGGHDHAQAIEAAPPASPSVSPSHDHHDDPDMETAHERLTKGHLHAMGLGLVTISLSLVLAFLEAPDKVKTFASIFLGVGGLFYPLSWIIMGYRTTALGPEGAEASVLPIVGFSIVLVLIGAACVIIYLLKGLGARR